MGEGTDALNRQATSVFGREDALSPIPSDPAPLVEPGIQGGTRTCAYCGAANSPAARYCGVCGRPATQQIAAGGRSSSAPVRSTTSGSTNFERRSTTPRETPNDEVAATRARIDELRHHMGETIDEIQDRLSPGHIVGEAKSAVREATIGRAQTAINSAEGAGSTMIDTIRQNPIPAAMVAAGLGWLYMATRRRPSNTAYSRPTYGRSAYGGSNWQTQDTQSGVVSQVQDRAGQVAGQAQQTVSTLAGQVQGSLAGAGGQIQETASQLTGQIQDTASQLTGQIQGTASQVTGQVQDQVTQFGNAAQQQMQQAQSGFQQKLQEQPLAVGAVAVALGIAAGLAIPQTQKEHELMGPARDAVLEQAQEKAQDAAQKVQSVAQEAIGAATDAAQQEAAEQGLTTQPLQQ